MVLDTERAADVEFTVSTRLLSDSVKAGGVRRKGRDGVCNRLV